MLVYSFGVAPSPSNGISRLSFYLQWFPRFDEGSFGGEDLGYEEAKLSHSPSIHPIVRDTSYSLVGSLKVKVKP